MSRGSYVMKQCCLHCMPGRIPAFLGTHTFFPLVTLEVHFSKPLAESDIVYSNFQVAVGAKERIIEGLCLSQILGIGCRSCFDCPRTHTAFFRFA